MPHIALNAVQSVEDAVTYWEMRLQEEAEAEAAAANHYTVKHPPNVTIGGEGRGQVITEWRQKHATQHQPLTGDQDNRLADDDEDEDDEDADELLSRQSGRS